MITATGEQAGVFWAAVSKLVAGTGMVPVKEVARLMGKDQQFIRQGIIRGVLPIGIAFKKTITDSKWGEEKESSQYDFYISPKLLWEYTGIIYKKEDK